MTTPRAFTFLSVALVSGAALAAPPAPSPVFMHVFPVTVDERLPAGQVDLAVGSDDKAFGELTKRGVGKLKAGRVRVRLGEYPRSEGRALRKFSECSFMVDCAEPKVLAVAEQLEQDVGRAAGSDELAAWVARFIVKKSYRRAIDVASVVAESREGDCTEHAVLLAALARHRGIPARVVLGLVLVEIRGQATGAFGHAWVEVHDGRRWLPKDAALRPDELAKEAGGPVHLDYLPIQIMEREDAGYAAGLLKGHSVLEVTQVSVPAAAHPADGRGP